MITDIRRETDRTENHWDLVRRLENLTEEIPYRIRIYKNQVSHLLSIDKKLTALQDKADKSVKASIVSKIEVMSRDYASAYKRCNSSYSDITEDIERSSLLFAELSDYYLSRGNRRAAKRVTNSSVKFEKDMRRLIEPSFSAMNSISNISYLKALEENAPEEEVENKIQEQTGAHDKKPEYEARKEYEAPQYRPIRQSAESKEAYRPPVNFQPVPSFNIAPISIDVNRAVESAIERFEKIFEERIATYLEAYKIPEKEPAVTGEETEASALVLEAAAENLGFASERLSALLDKTAELLSGVSEMNKAYSELEEKHKATVESARALSDMQRALTREIQGIQVTQKLINQDQAQVAEEQSAILEKQKAILEKQAEIPESEEKLLSEEEALIKRIEELDGALKEINAVYSEIAAGEEEILKRAGKALEAQRSLTEKQGELTEMQREAVVAHRRQVRSQKAINEKVES